MLACIKCFKGQSQKSACGSKDSTRWFSLATPLLCNRLAGLCVVNQSCDVELEQLSVLLDDVLWSPVFFLFSQPVVGLDDIR